MVEAMGRHTAELGIPYFPPGDARQGIVHVMGPEQGFTLPGITLVCGDSHTATHGAFGCLAFGIGSSELEHVLATSCLWQTKPRAMRIRVEGACPPGVAAKDVIPPSSRASAPPAARARDRVRGYGHRRHVHGRADDGVQHVHRGGRPRGDGGADQRTYAFLEGRPFAPASAGGTRPSPLKTLPTDAGADSTPRWRSTPPRWSRR